MTFSLGGPGVACSSMTVRRLAAGELSGEAGARAEAHLAGCARCQAAARELEAERRALAAELPFEAFAAGVAERLAAGAAAAPVRPAWRRAGPLALALAASLAVAVAAPLVARLASGRSPFVADDGTRIKGGASATLHLRVGAGSRPLDPGEPVPADASLRIGLAPAGHRFAAAAVLDEDGPALLFDGSAVDGPGRAFRWTGRRGLVVVVYDDRPIDGPALLERLARGGPGAAGPGGAAEVVLLPLSRGGP